ncbi:MAG: GTPase HflX [Candidatus Hydrogenedentota bacterium]|nr:MAG: GTPase HflX [Candidatus Hydrogenedentota bacterium]
MDASQLIRHSIRSDETYRAILVGHYGSRLHPNKRVQQESLRELFLLSDTAGVKSMQELFLYLREVNPATFLPSGQIEKIKEMIAAYHINLLIIDSSLKPNQLKNLEEILNIRVLGRIELILDIFAYRARTRAAALQVELAQLEYILPRLKGLGGVLSRLGGGIGTRGPGETMLETDRRHIRRRIQRIKRELEKVRKHRENTRKHRSIPTFSIVGYTNAGKSSLLNQLASSSKKVFAEDRLFATLDSFTRKVYLGENNYKPNYALLTDTVGFIRNLPASLVAAFQSTLEEITFTDGIIQVQDASSPYLEEEMEVVNEELNRLGVAKKPKLLFFNKDDLVFEQTKKELRQKYPEAIWGNTLSKEGVADLRKALQASVIDFGKHKIVV